MRRHRRAVKLRSMADITPAMPMGINMVAVYSYEFHLSTKIFFCLFFFSVSLSNGNHTRKSLISSLSSWASSYLYIHIFFLDCVSLDLSFISSQNRSFVWI
jgi:hypothetical protein